LVLGEHRANLTDQKVDAHAKVVEHALR
jgi:hypothetical protein